MIDSIRKSSDPQQIQQFLKQNEDRIKKIFPETWTHSANLNLLQIGFQFKLVGLDWRSDDDLVAFFVLLEKANFILRDGEYLIKRNPNPAMA